MAPICPARRPDDVDLRSHGSRKERELIRRARTEARLGGCMGTREGLGRRDRGYEPSTALDARAAACAGKERSGVRIGWR